MQQSAIAAGASPGPRWEAYSAPTNPLAAWAEERFYSRGGQGPVIAQNI